MRKVPIFAWVLAGFFFFAGLGLAAWEETSWIGIGQIWMAVAVFLVVVFLLVSGRLKGKLGLGEKFSSGGSGGNEIGAAKTIQLKPGGLASRILGKVMDAANSAGTIQAERTAGAGDPTPATVAAGDTAEQLARLERLHRSGDLTDAEYQAQRQRIISAI